MYEVGKVTPLFYTKSRYPNLYFVGFCELFEGNLSLQNLIDSRRRRINFLPSSGFVGNKFLPFYETDFLGSCFRAKSRKVVNIGWLVSMLKSLRELLFFKSKNLKIYIMRKSYAKSVILKFRWAVVIFDVVLAFGKEIFADLFFENIIDNERFQKDFSEHFGTFFVGDLS